MYPPLDSFPLRELATLLLAGRGGRWQVRDDPYWCHLSPRDYPSRVQGWKLHVSATWLSAPMVLHRAGRVLVEQECAFKFAGTMGRARELTGKTADRAQAGKFLTVYPRDDEHLRHLAPLLDQATADLPGPAILSDRPVREGSLVHYRYGAFSGVPVLTNDGLFEQRIEAPDGSLAEDSRQPWFCPPPWAVLPFGGRPGRAAKAPAKPKPVLLDGRFRVEKALIHTARGGVFRAVDQRTGRAVVVKQARAHISGLSHAGDARDALRHEAAMLKALAGLTPEVVSLFEQGDRVFLAVAELAGQPLGSWVRERWRDAGDAGLPPDEAIALALRLADLLDAVHERGYVFRDLSPGNIMVLADGALRLVDAELAAPAGAWVAQAFTHGFVAPEVENGPPIGPAPGPEADNFALGALLLHLTTGARTAFVPDVVTGGGESGSRTSADQINLLLEYAVAGNPAAQRLATAIAGLTAADPQQRWDTARLREFLAAPPPPVPVAPAGAPEAALAPARQQRLLDDGLAYLAATLNPAAVERLVPTGAQAPRADPCNVQYGAAGVLAVLVRATELAEGGDLAWAVERVARWIDRRRLGVPRLLPGLYFGRSGTAWALHAAARLLDDEPMAERALELALAIPANWPNPDLTHGTAGAGMASLYLWQQTKEQAFRERVDTAIDQLAAHSARTPEGRLHWRVPADFDSALAGVAQYGFAHGLSGIAAFLLAAGQATGREDALSLARQAGETLAAAAIRHDGAVYWPNDLSGPSESDLRYHWCHGASGVGTFLVRLWQATGELRYRLLAHEAAVMVRRGRWFSGISACHGLAGDGEFLLDLAAATGPDEPYRGWAEELAACLYVRHARRGDRLVVTEEIGPSVPLDFGTGAAGAVGFLLRLRHGGPRWWMVDGPGPV